MTTENAKHPSEMNYALRIVKRYRLLLFVFTVAGFLSSLFLTKITKPTYTATAQIIFDQRDVDTAFVETQKTLFLSDNLIHDTVDRLGMAEQVSDYIANNLKIQTSENSHVIETEYESHSEPHAVKILAALLDQYKIEKQQEHTPETSPLEYVEDLYQRTLVQIEGNIKDAQQELSALQKVKPRSESVPASDILALNRAEHDYTLAQQSLERVDNGDYSESGHTLRALQAKHSQQESMVNALSERYGHKHPKMVSAMNDLSLTAAQIKDAQQAIKRNVMAQYEDAKSRLQTTVANINTRPTVNPHQDRIDELSEEINIASKTQGSFEGQYMELIANMIEPSAGEDASSPLTFTITTPRILHTEISDQKTRTLILGTLAAMLGGILASLLLELSRRNFLSGRELQDALGHPCYALVPQTKADKNKPLADYVIDNPISTTTEAVRTLKLAMKLNAAHDSPKVIALTSSAPGEGKTTLSAWIAKLSAKSGQKVILIDTDFRKPNVHRTLGQDNTSSLVEYLVGAKELSEVLDTSDPSGLHVLYGRDVPNSATDLIASDKMTDLIQRLRDEYDLIILDTPACMSVSDTLSVARYSELLLYVVSWNKTKKETVHNGISQFEKFPNTQIATVLTNIDLKKHVQYGYGDAIIHYGGYQAA